MERERKKERNVLIDEEIVIEIWNLGRLRCREREKKGEKCILINEEIVIEIWNFGGLCGGEKCIN